MHVQSLGAEVHLGQVHQALGVGRAEELAHLDGTRFTVLLALPAKPCPCEPPGSRRQGARGRFERTHAGVLNAHTEGLSLSLSFIFPCLVDDSSNHSLYLIELFNFSYPE